MGNKYDVIIVGGGSNGLSCAAYLARDGKRVLVLEAASVVGGFATTEELTPKAPGFRYNKNAIDLFSGMLPVSVISELNLARYGLQVRETDPYATYVAQDGSSICQWRDVHRTAEEISRYSPHDAKQYVRFAQMLGDVWNVALPRLQGHPRRYTYRALVQTIVRAAKARKSLQPAARILLSSPAQVINEWFERDELKVILGTWAAATSKMSLDSPGTSSGMVMSLLCHRWGCYRAVGGMGAVTRALTAYILAHGGEIRTDAPVANIIVTDDHRATGVALQSGEEIYAADVVGAVDPTTLFKKLLDHRHLSEDIHTELRGMTVGTNITSLTGHAALSARPGLPRHGREDVLLRAGYQMLIPSYASLERSLAAAQRGDVPEELPVWVSYPSICDRSLVPEGSVGETLYFLAPVVPYELSDGRNWSDQKKPFFDKAMDIAGGYFSGLKENIIDSQVVSPQDRSRWVTKGHPNHIDMTLSQMGPWRPTPSLSGYKTPVEGLWHVSAGSHGMPSVNGWAGRTAARTLLRDRG